MGSRTNHCALACHTVHDLDDGILHARGHLVIKLLFRSAAGPLFAHCHTVHNSIYGRSIDQHSVRCNCNHSATAAALRPPAILQTGCRMSFAISCSPSGSMSAHKSTLLEACDSRHCGC